MKKLTIFCIVLLAFAAKVTATEWYGYYYEFPHFKYCAEQLLGSEAPVPDMFPVAVRLNQYVKELQGSGKLKNKPVVYDIYTTVFMESDERQGKKRYLLEIYETDEEYRINVNYRENFVLTFTQRELVQIIDYFVSEHFEPFFCDTTMARIALSKEVLLNKLNSAALPSGFMEKEEYEVYATDQWSIKMIGSSMYIFYDDKKIDMKLYYPIIEPVKFNDRLILLHKDRFSVFEQGKCIKSLEVPDILWNVQTESNSNSKIKVYSQWLNINQYEKVRYSYSYRENRFYDLR